MWSCSSGPFLSNCQLHAAMTELREKQEALRLAKTQLEAVIAKVDELRRKHESSVAEKNALRDEAEALEVCGGVFVAVGLLRAPVLVPGSVRVGLSVELCVGPCVLVRAVTHSPPPPRVA